MKHRDTILRWGVAVFLTVSAILLFYDTLFGQRVLLLILRKLLAALQPVLFGVFIAYLLSPGINFFEQRLFTSNWSKDHTAMQKVSRGRRAASLLLMWVLIGALVYLLASFLLPELYKSILVLISNAETYYGTITNWVEQLLETNPALEAWATAQIATYYQDINGWLTNSVLPQASTVMNVLSGGLFGTLIFLKNLLVGMIVSVYYLATKERCLSHGRKLVYSLFSEKNVYWIFRGASKADRVFSGFVRGKLLDSLIIGILCFIGCSILNMPYTPLISVIVGVTNVIPFFGPFLGAIPSIFLILLVEPVKALYFMIFVLGLQQLDGNFIGPKILGGSTGLSSLWVIVAILVGGSFFGLPGMFFGVPICACLYSAVTFFVDSRLRKRNMPVETSAYAVGAEPPPDTQKPPVE